MSYLVNLRYPPETLEVVSLEMSFLYHGAGTARQELGPYDEGGGECVTSEGAGRALE